MIQHSIIAAVLRAADNYQGAGASHAVVDSHTFSDVFGVGGIRFCRGVLPQGEWELFAGRLLLTTSAEWAREELRRGVKPEPDRLHGYPERHVAEQIAEQVVNGGHDSPQTRLDALERVIEHRHIAQRLERDLQLVALLGADFARTERDRKA